MPSSLLPVGAASSVVSLVSRSIATVINSNCIIHEATLQCSFKKYFCPGDRTSLSLHLRDSFMVLKGELSRILYESISHTHILFAAIFLKNGITGIAK